MQNQEKIIKAIAEYLERNTLITSVSGENPLECMYQLAAEQIAATIAPHLEARAEWEDAPSWANYLAMDANGYWWWYEEKPQLSRGIWAFGGERSRKTLHKQDVAWNESLQERPK